METTRPIPRSYVDFEPSSEWVADKKFDTLVLNLPGFKKEQIKVQIDNYRNLRTSGERPLDGNRWTRFRKDFYIPENLNISEIRAKFENAALYVILPKFITQEETPEPPVVNTQQPAAKATDSSEPNVASWKEENGKVNEQAEARKEDPHEGGASAPAEKEDPATEKQEISSNSAALKETEKAWSGGEGIPWKPRQLLMNVVVAVMVLVGLWVSVTYKVR